MVLAFIISSFEAIQLAIQLKVLKSINEKLAKVDDIIAKLETSYDHAGDAIRQTLNDLVAPVRDKFLGLDVDTLPVQIGAQVQEAIAKYCSNIDTQAIIDSLGETIVAKMQEAIPDMIGEAGETIEQEKQLLIKNARKDPLGTFIALAMQKTQVAPKLDPAGSAGSSMIRKI